MGNYLILIIFSSLAHFLPSNIPLMTTDTCTCVYMCVYVYSSDLILLKGIPSVKEIYCPCICTYAKFLLGHAH